MTSRQPRLRAADAVPAMGEPDSAAGSPARGGASPRRTRRGEPKPTLLSLMVLGLLAESPMHPYEMQRLMTERAKDTVMKVQRGSLYPAVERMVEAGLAEPVATVREGRRPERTVYQITDYGRDVVENWLLGMLREPKREYPEFPAALAFIALVSPGAALNALEARLLRLTAEVAGMEALGEELKGQLPRLFYIESEFQHALLRAELDYVRALTADLRSGELVWSRELIEQWVTDYRLVGESLSARTEPPV